MRTRWATQPGARRPVAVRPLLQATATIAAPVTAVSGDGRGRGLGAGCAPHDGEGAGVGG